MRKSTTIRWCGRSGRRCSKSRCGTATAACVRARVRLFYAVLVRTGGDPPHGHAPPDPDAATPVENAQRDVMARARRVHAGMIRSGGTAMVLAADSTAAAGLDGQCTPTVATGPRTSRSGWDPLFASWSALLHGPTASNASTCLVWPSAAPHRHQHGPRSRRAKVSQRTCSCSRPSRETAGCVLSTVPDFFCPVGIPCDSVGRRRL